MPGPTARRDPPRGAVQRASFRKPRGRTSRAELPVSGPGRPNRGRIAREPCPPSQRHHGSGPGGRSRDATDKGSYERRSCGRTRARLYNAIHPHGNLEYQQTASETIISLNWSPGSATIRPRPSLADKPSLHYYLNWTSRQGQVKTTCRSMTSDTAISGPLATKNGLPPSSLPPSPPSSPPSAPHAIFTDAASGPRRLNLILNTTARPTSNLS